MASTSQAKRFRRECELLQILEDSTDSELSSGSLFRSDKSTRDSDSENLGDNPEIVDDVQEGGVNENIITGTWSNCGKWHHTYFDNYFSSVKRM
jgi:hypothetical protein